VRKGIDKRCAMVFTEGVSNPEALAQYEAEIAAKRAALPAAYAAFLADPANVPFPGDNRLPRNSRNPYGRVKPRARMIAEAQAFLADQEADR
jgi:hypothetical protein